MGADTDAEGFYRRNLVYLLRRIPKPEEPDPTELDLLIAHSHVGGPYLLVREAIVTLAQWKERKAIHALRQHLQDIEQALVQGGGTMPYTDEELYGLLDRTIVALAHMGHPDGYRAVVTHALVCA